MNALANEEIGSILNAHCVCAFHKVGTFTIIGDQKIGGNVASYFCTPDGRVLHCVPGKVDAATMLREAQWVVETRGKALAAANGYPTYLRTSFQKAHSDRLLHDHKIDVDLRRPQDGRHFMQVADRWGEVKHVGTPQARTHLMLSLYPLARIDQVYQVVFTGFLHEPISDRPVKDRHAWE